MKFRPLRHKVAKKLKVKKEYILPLCLGVFVAKKMKSKSKQHGLTLTEMTIVVASIVLLVALGLPAVRAFFTSFQTETGAKTMISAALSSARAIALKERRYAGIRFQKACLSRDVANPLTGLLEAPQYMIFIVYEEPKKMGNLTVGFRAVEGLKPVKLPDAVGVIDLSVIDSRRGNADIDEDFELSNATSFSIIFSPSGKLVIHDVRVRNREGDFDPNTPNDSMDDVFNSPINIIINGFGMFIQDDYPGLGLFREPSRNCFTIYDRKEFARAYQRRQAYSGYLYRLAPKPIYINPYTGTIISTD